MVRRLVFLFLAVLLPLQLAWGAVSVYCQHEAGARAKHFGHHEHVHKVDAKKTADLKVAPDNDCWTCHAAGSTALLGATASVPELCVGQAPAAEGSRAPPSLPPESPDRPQWPRLA